MASKLEFYGIPIINASYNPAMPGTIICRPDPEQLKYPFKPPVMFNSLASCCIKSECLNNFIDLPRTLVLSAVHQLAWTNDMLQYPSFCIACEAPCVCERAFKFLVIDRVGQVEAHLKSQEIEWTRLTTSSEESILYYAYRLRYQHRLAHAQTRRNFVNILVIHPYTNSYRFHHFTFRYVSRLIPTHHLINRVLNEAVGQLDQDINSKKPFHCYCKEVTTAATAPAPATSSAATPSSAHRPTTSASLHEESLPTPSPYYISTPSSSPESLPSP